MKQQTLAVADFERYRRRSRKFSELLQDSRTRHRNRAIETAQVIEGLIAMAKQFQAASRGEQLGLTTDEMAFYDALVPMRHRCGSWGMRCSARSLRS